LRRFLRGEPVEARPSSTWERIVKWSRRHPARTAAWLAGIVALGAVLGTFLWTASRRAAIDRAVTEDLAEAVRLEESADWPGARNAVERAGTRLLAGGGGDENPLALRATAIERELDVVVRLGAMRLERGASEHADFDPKKWWDSYREAFSA